MPALFTMTSRPPNRSTAVDTRLSTSAARVKVADDDARAFGNESPGYRETQPLRAAGDDRRLAAQHRHLSPLTVQSSCSLVGRPPDRHTSYFIYDFAVVPPPPQKEPRFMTTDAGEPLGRRAADEVVSDEDFAYILAQTRD